MVEINSGIVSNIILKAREINIADDMGIPDNSEDYSDVEWKEILVEYKDDITYLELKNLIDELEPDQQIQLIALMYVGRGDFSENEWTEALQQAMTIEPESRSVYLISKKMLPDYLTEGLAAFGYTPDE